jgi:uncharacterized protein (DUF4213/DUF364 family)
MGALEDLTALATQRAVRGPHQVVVDDVVVGVHYTAVRTGRGRASGPGDPGRVGLAATMATGRCCDAPPRQERGHLHERSAAELVALTGSADPLDRSVGLAAVNAVLARTRPDGSEVNAMDLVVEHGRGRFVVTVGHFPATPVLRSAAGELHVLERDPRPGDDPAEAAAELIPRADVIGLTATTLLNGTFEALMALVAPRCRVIMLGLSTPLSPLLFDHGVAVLAGAVVTDPGRLLHGVGQGAARRQLTGLRRVTLARDGALLHRRATA